jgi:hypothetical protein
MSLLSMVQEVASKVVGTNPSAITTATGSADQNVLQMVRAVNEAGRQTASRAAWQVLRNEATFTTQAVENQGSILTIAGADFNFVVNETFWDRTTRRPIFGPKSAAEWQQLKAQVVLGPWYQFTIRGNNLLFLPVPPAGDACYFEWVSKNWATDSTGTTGKSTMDADTDVAKLDESLLALDAIWRFKNSKGLPWQEDFDKAERAISDALGRDGAKSRLNMGGGPANVWPSILVPAGSWAIAGEPSE